MIPPSTATRPATQKPSVCRRQANPVGVGGDVPRRPVSSGNSYLAATQMPQTGVQFPKIPLNPPQVGFPVLLTGLPKIWVLQSPPPFPLFAEVLTRLRESNLAAHL